MAAAAPAGMKGFYGVLAVVALIGLGVLGWQLAKPKTASIPVNVAVQPADTAGFRGYVLGSPQAPVEITEYADYQCPACQSFEAVQFPDVKRDLIDTGKLRWRYRDFPLNQHQFARLAAHAAACADEQGKFWEMHGRIYAGQSDWAFQRDAGPTFAQYASAIGLDGGRYDACMSSGKFAGRIQASLNEGEQAGVGSTPTFLVGGRLYPGALGSDQIRRLVDSLAALAPAAPAAPAPAPATP